MTPAERTELKDKMTASFSFSEVKDLCFSLGIDSDSVPGETKPDKIRELILMCERRGRVDELVSAVNSQIKKVSGAKPANDAPQPSAKSDPNKKITILFLAANPKDTPQLRLDEEVRTIDEKLRQASLREKFDLKSHWAVRTTDIIDAMLRHAPDIVHFAGHGTKGDLVFENKAGLSQPVSPEALAMLFEAAEGVRCVVMNACYSDLHADSVTKVVDCVMGMRAPISDEAALSFASGFYRSLGDGKTVQRAFNFGKAQIMLDGGDEQKTPHLRTRKGVDANDVRFE